MQRELCVCVCVVLLLVVHVFQCVCVSSHKSNLPGKIINIARSRRFGCCLNTKVDKCLSLKMSHAGEDDQMKKM